MACQRRQSTSRINVESGEIVGAVVTANVKCMDCSIVVEVLKIVRLSDKDRFLVYMCGCRVKKAPPLDGLSPEDRYMRLLLQTDNYRSDFLVQHMISIHNQDGVWRSAGNYIWYNEKCFLFRESGTKRLILIKFHDLKKGAKEEYLKVPKTMEEVKVLSAYINAKDELGILWIDGSFSLPSNPNQAIKPLKTADQWHLIVPVLKSYNIIHGIRSSKTSFNLTLTMIRSTNSPTITATLKCPRPDRIYALQQLIQIQPSKTATYLLGVSIQSYVHIFYCTKSSLHTVSPFIKLANSSIDTVLCRLTSRSSMKVYYTSKLRLSTVDVKLS